MSINVISHAASNQAHRQLGQTQPTGAGIAQLVYEWKVIAYVVADADAAAPLTQDKRLSQESLIPQGIVILPAIWDADTVADSERGEAQPAPLERIGEQARSFGLQSWHPVDLC